MYQPSVEELMESRSGVPYEGVVYRAAKMPSTYDPETRSAQFVMTDETEDSYGDIVRASGGKLDRFQSNPIALLNHNSDKVLGTWDNIMRGKSDITGTVKLAKAGTADYIDSTAMLMEQGILRAASIGFMPGEVELIQDDDGNWTGGIEFKEWEMSECSVVAIPANPAALAKSIKMGNSMALEFIEEILDNFEMTKSGLIMPRGELEEVYREGTGDRTVKSNADIVLKAEDLFAEGGIKESPVPKISIKDKSGETNSFGDWVKSIIAGNHSRNEPAPEPEMTTVEGSLERAKALRESLNAKLADNQPEQS